jgi:formamidopyrimidine-DNA glycosylase
VWHMSFENHTTNSPPLPLRLEIIRAYEMMCLNLSTHITHYRLRLDGALVLVDKGEINCVMCHVPESLSQSLVREHLHSRANSIRKILRDRRIVVEIGNRTSVYSCETLQRRNILTENLNNTELKVLS